MTIYEVDCPEFGGSADDPYRTHALSPAHAAVRWAEREDLYQYQAIRHGKLVTARVRMVKAEVFAQETPWVHYTVWYGNDPAFGDHPTYLAKKLG